MTKEAGIYSGEEIVASIWDTRRTGKIQVKE